MTHERLYTDDPPTIKFGLRKRIFVQFEKKKPRLMVIGGPVGNSSGRSAQEEAGRQGGKRERGLSKREESRWTEGEERMEGMMMADEGADGGVGLVVELSTKEERALDPSKPS